MAWQDDAACYPDKISAELFSSSALILRKISRIISLSIQTS